MLAHLRLIQSFASFGPALEQRHDHWPATDPDPWSKPTPEVAEPGFFELGGREKYVELTVVEERLDGVRNPGSSHAHEDPWAQKAHKEFVDVG